MVRFLLALTLLISGCASVPRYSEDPQNCNPETWSEEYNHDLWNYAKAAGRTFERAMPYICKDEAEVIVEGNYLGGKFSADQLQTKCASRYEGDLKDQSAYKYENI